MSPAARRPLLALGVLALALGPAPGLAGSGGGGPEACGALVCAGASADIAMDCGKALGGDGLWFAWCTVRMTAAVAGSSPAYLPGRVDGSATGRVAFTCVNGCASRNVEESAAYGAAWRGGPEAQVGPLFLSDHAGAGGTVLRETVFTFQAPDGQPACVHANASLLTRATATVVDLAATEAPLERAAAEDDASSFGNACV